MQLSARMHSCVHLMFPKPNSRGADVNIYADKRTEKFHWRWPPDQELSLMKMQATEGGIEGQLFATMICCFPHDPFLGVSTFRRQLRQKMTTNSGKLKLIGCLTAGFLLSLLAWFSRCYHFWVLTSTTLRSCSGNSPNCNFHISISLFFKEIWFKLIIQWNLACCSFHWNICTLPLF